MAGHGREDGRPGGASLPADGGGKERRNVFADADEEAAARLVKMMDWRLEMVDELARGGIGERRIGSVEDGRPGGASLPADGGGKERRNVFADADEEAAARRLEMVDLRLEMVDELARWRIGGRRLVSVEDGRPGGASLPADGGGKERRNVFADAAGMRVMLRLVKMVLTRRRKW